ncbi:hypothetical protein ACQPYE_26445 [Actinosynnema sp. CA-299493]
MTARAVKSTWVAARERGNPALRELHEAILRLHRGQPGARRLPTWFDFAVKCGWLLPLAHYTLVVFHLDATLEQRQRMEELWRTARCGQEGIDGRDGFEGLEVWTPPTSTAGTESDKNRSGVIDVHSLIRDELDAAGLNRLYDQTLVEDVLVKSVRTVLRPLIQALMRRTAAAMTLPTEPDWEADDPVESADGRILINHRVSEQVGEPGAVAAVARAEVDVVRPCVPTAAEDLRADTPRQFAEMLERIRANSGFPARRLARMAKVPHGSVHRMLDPARGVLPTKPDSVRAFVTTCGLLDEQTEQVMQIWARLHHQQTARRSSDAHMTEAALDQPLVELHESIAALLSSRGQWRQAYQHLRSAFDLVYADQCDQPHVPGQKRREVDRVPAENVVRAGQAAW